MELTGQLLEPNRGVRTHYPQWRRALIANLPHQSERSLRIKRRSARAEGINDTAQREEVRSKIDVAACKLLGRHVKRRTHPIARPRDLHGIVQPSQAEVRDLDSV